MGVRVVADMSRQAAVGRVSVGIVGGSTSDFPILEKAVALLNELSENRPALKQQVSKCIQLPSASAKRLVSVIRMIVTLPEN